MHPPMLAVIVTEYVPGFVYVTAGGVYSAEVAGEPPVNVHAYVPPTVDVFVKFTVRSSQPVNVAGVITAVGIGFTVTVCCTVSGPQKPFTIKVTVNVPAVL